MEYIKGNTYDFFEQNSDRNRFRLRINTEHIIFIMDTGVVCKVPTKLFAQILKDSLEEKT